MTKSDAEYYSRGLINGTIKITSNIPSDPPIDYDVSEWIRIGKDRGYEAYLKQQWRERLLEELLPEKKR